MQARPIWHLHIHSAVLTTILTLTLHDDLARLVKGEGGMSGRTDCVDGNESKTVAGSFEGVFSRLTSILSTDHQVPSQRCCDAIARTVTNASHASDVGKGRMIASTTTLVAAYITAGGKLDVGLNTGI